MEGWQSLEHPSLGESMTVLCLAEGLKKVVLVFFSYNLNYFQEKTITTHCGHSSCYQVFLSLLGIQRYLQHSEGKNKTKQNTTSSSIHQLFYCFLNLTEYLFLVPWKEWKCCRCQPWTIYLIFRNYVHHSLVVRKCVHRSSPHKNFPRCLRKGIKQVRSL